MRRLVLFAERLLVAGLGVMTRCRAGCEVARVITSFGGGLDADRGRRLTIYGGRGSGGELVDSRSRGGAG